MPAPPPKHLGRPRAPRQATSASAGHRRLPQPAEKRTACRSAFDARARQQDIGSAAGPGPTHVLSTGPGPAVPTCLRSGGLLAEVPALPIEDLLAEVPASRHRPLGLEAVLPLAQRVPLVVLALALRDRELDLRPAVLEVEGQRHGRVPALRPLRRELQYLLLVQQQLAAPPRRVVRPGALVVLRDVPGVEPRLPAVDERVPVDERRATSAERLHLGAGEHEARLEGVLDRVVVPRLAVARHHLAALLPRHGALPRACASGRKQPPSLAPRGVPGPGRVAGRWRAAIAVQSQPRRRSSK